VSLPDFQERHVSLSDDVERLTRIVVRQHQDGYRSAEALRYASFGLGKDNARALAKLCGTTPETIVAWERGVLAPTTVQALAWLGALYDSLPSTFSAQIQAAAEKAAAEAAPA
jgi:hypothetical protein